MIEALANSYSRNMKTNNPGQSLGLIFLLQQVVQFMFSEEGIHEGEDVRFVFGR
jgi:hypothetical protein